MNFFLYWKPIEACLLPVTSNYYSLLDCIFFFYFKVLQSTLKWLDDWEQRVVDKLIKTDHFLTSNTAEGLRITLTSSMQICCYLKEKYDINYVLTGKINQDSLEVIKKLI